MESQSITEKQLLDEMSRGVTVVTGNAYPARWLTSQFGTRKVVTGETTWSTPDVVSWPAWVTRTWDNAVADGLAPAHQTLLSDEQELRVWKEIVAEKAHGLLRTGATAQRAKATWRLLVEWRLEHRLLAEHSTEDYQAFCEWQTAFEQRCTENAWLPSARVADKLTALFEQGRLKLHGELLLIGFDELNPGQQRFLNSLRQAGNSAKWITLEGRKGRASRVLLPDSRSEIAMLSQWVRQRVKDNATASIGIVVPDLVAHATALEHQLTRVLAPGSLIPGRSVSEKPWSFSRGRALRSFPMVQTAFAVLRLLRGAVAMTDLTDILLSPFIGGWEEEGQQRALLDARLRDDGELSVRFDRVLQLSQARTKETGQPKAWDSPLLARGWSALRAVRSKLGQSATPTAWSAYFAECLSAIGWSTGRALNAAELQVVDAWRTLLNDFSALDTVCQSLSYAEALEQLSDLSHRRMLHPKTTRTQIHVVGLNEANGLAFDHLWVMGLHDSVWPPAPRPDPYLPLAVQRANGLPHASVEREYETAAKVTQRLACAADEVVFSHPARAGDEGLRLSPLLSSLTPLDERSLGIERAAGWRDRVCQSGRLEQLIDATAPPLGTDIPSGGSGILKSQSLCPFRAFARHRLGAAGFREAMLGLDPMKKGSLLHRCLELFWENTRDHQRLVALTDKELDAAIARAVEAALADAERSSELVRHSRRFRTLEKERLTQTLRVWLQMEKDRAPFSVVGLERELDEVRIEGVPLRLVVDRIDELADGRKLVIDYKTGSISPSEWFGERPDDPQLPLYSTVTQGPIGGVLFGQLRAGKLQFKGVVAEEGIIPGLPPARMGPEKEATESWPQVLADWQATIHTLAHGFAAGHAAVAPTNGLATCQKGYCDLQALCRVHELLEADDETETVE